MDGRKPGSKLNTSFTFIVCKWIAVIATTALLVHGSIFVYCGVIAGTVQCTNKDTHKLPYYHWKCSRYYSPDLVFVSIQVLLSVISGVALLFGHKKSVQLPLISFLTVITVFLILGFQKYAHEDSRMGYFLQPHKTNGDDGEVHHGKTYPVESNSEAVYDYSSETKGSEDGYSRQKYRAADKSHRTKFLIKNFEVVELRGVYTMVAPRVVICIGYSFLISGNVMLILFLGLGKIPSILFPQLGGYKKTMEKFRSQLSSMIAPGTRPSSSDEEDEEHRLVQREPTNV